MQRSGFWGPVLAAAGRGDLPLIRTGCTAASVGQAVGGGRPVYLATPYSRQVIDHAGEFCHEKSVHQMMLAARVSAGLLSVGVTALSPIVLSAAMVHACGAFRGNAKGRVAFVSSLDPLDADLWARWCQPLLNVCAAVVVPDFPGWDRSDGIRAEVEWAVLHNLPVFVFAHTDAVVFDG
jgi:hypothetical protein